MRQQLCPEAIAHTTTERANRASVRGSNTQRGAPASLIADDRGGRCQAWKSGPAACMAAFARSRTRDDKRSGLTYARPASTFDAGNRCVRIKPLCARRAPCADADIGASRLFDLTRRLPRPVLSPPRRVAQGQDRGRDGRHDTIGSTRLHVGHDLWCRRWPFLLDFSLRQLDPPRARRFKGTPGAAAAALYRGEPPRCRACGLRHDLAVSPSGAVAGCCCLAPISRRRRLCSAGVIGAHSTDSRLLKSCSCGLASTPPAVCARRTLGERC